MAKNTQSNTEVERLIRPKKITRLPSQSASESCGACVKTFNFQDQTPSKSSPIIKLSKLSINKNYPQVDDFVGFQNQTNLTTQSDTDKERKWHTQTILAETQSTLWTKQPLDGRKSALPSQATALPPAALSGKTPSITAQPLFARKVTIIVTGTARTVDTATILSSGNLNPLKTPNATAT